MTVLDAGRIGIATQALGIAEAAYEAARRYAVEREAFGQPIGAYQGVQFPIAQAHMATEAADLMRHRGAQLLDANERCGAECNMAKYLSGEAVWQAANACMDTFGGYGFATEYDVERKFRLARLYRMGPVNANLVLAHVAQHVLGLPRSY